MTLASIVITGAATLFVSGVVVVTSTSAQNGITSGTVGIIQFDAATSTQDVQIHEPALGGVDGTRTQQSSRRLQSRDLIRRPVNRGATGHFNPGKTTLDSGPIFGVQ